MLSNTPFKFIFKLVLVGGLLFTTMPVAGAKRLAEVKSPTLVRHVQRKSLESTLEELIRAKRYNACGRLIESSKSKFLSSDYRYWRAKLCFAEQVSEAEAYEKASRRKYDWNYVTGPQFYGLVNLSSKLRSALALINSSIRNRPGHAQYYALRSEIYNAGQMKAEAIIDITRAINLSPHSARSYFLRASYWVYGFNDFERSKNFKCQNISLRRKFAKIGCLEDYQKRDDLALKEAISDLDVSIALNKNSAESYSLRAKVRSGLDQPNVLSLEDCSRAIQLEPKNPKFWSQRSHFWSDPIKSEKDEAQTLLLDPYDTEILLSRVRRLYDQGRYADCIAYFKTLDPLLSNPNYLNWRGSTFYLMGNLKEASNSWMRADDSLYVTQAAYVSYDLGNKAKALQLCNRVIAMRYGPKLQAHWLKVYLLHDKGLFSDALKECELLQKAVKSDSEWRYELLESHMALPKVTIDQIEAFSQCLRNKLTPRSVKVCASVRERL
jgi:alkylhydroperoxidase family enzyme